MQLYFIRHGQSENNALWNLTGDSTGRSEDPGLTDIGQSQAGLLAQYLQITRDGYAQSEKDLQNTQGFGLTHLYTSLMVRAVATGIEVGRVLELPLVAWCELHEGGGIYSNDPDTEEPVGLSGKNRAYFEKYFPELLLPGWLGDQGWWNRPYETRLERRRRARRFLADLLSRHGDTHHRVAVFSHGGFYNHFLATLLNFMDHEEQAPKVVLDALIADKVIPNTQVDMWFELNNAAITRIDFSPMAIRLVYQNRVDHIPAELIT